MNQKIFDPLICGASISEQHLQTELRQDKWYQLGIKTLNKIQKHWSELNNECIPMQQSVFAFFTWGASNSEQLLNLSQNCVKTGEIKYWWKPHQNPETLVGAK